MILPGCTAVAGVGFVIAALADPCARQPAIAAPGGVAVAGNIENSPISVINKTVNNQDPALLAALTKTFADQTAATAEARAKAEAKAAELAQKLGFTASAVAEFFKILGEQNVLQNKIPVRLMRSPLISRRLVTSWRPLSQMIRTRPNSHAPRKTRSTPGGWRKPTIFFTRPRKRSSRPSDKRESSGRERRRPKTVML